MKATTVEKEMIQRPAAPPHEAGLEPVAPVAKAAASRSIRPTTIIEFAVLLPLTLVAMEAVLGFAGVGQQEILQPDRQIGCVHIPGKKVTWRLEGFSNDSFSSAGLRDVEHQVQKPAGTLRIAFLGDSATEGLQVKMSETFAKKLEAQLIANASDTKQKHVEVLNFGCSSYSTGQELLQFDRQVAKYKPDLTVVLMVLGDTLENSVDLAHKGQAEPKPYFYLDHAGALKEDDSVLLANASKLAPNPVIDFLRRTSCLYGVWSQINFNWSLTDKLYFRLTHLARDICKRLEGKSKAVAAPIYPPQDQLKVTQALVASFNQRVKANQGKFALMVFPDITGSNVTWANDIAQLKTQGQSQGFDVIDLNQPFKAQKDPGSLFLEYHFSKEGHAVVADTVLQYLKSNLGWRVDK